jgi:hypothetical protein
MAKQVTFTNLSGHIIVLEKLQNGNTGITIAQGLQELIDKDITFYELEASDLPSLIHQLNILKNEVDVNVKSSFKVGNKIFDDTEFIDF